MIIKFLNFAKKFYLLITPQLYILGFTSLGIMIISGMFIGMVLALESYNILILYGSEQVIGKIVTFTLLRELGPVLTGLLYAGKAGSALTAEIGNMKITEQLLSLEMIGIDPIKYIVIPRFLAGIISMPLLTIIFSVIGIYCSAFISVELLGVYEGSYWSNIYNSIQFFRDILNGIIKSIIFAFIVTGISIYQGYNCHPTSEGLSKSTTNTFVYSSLSILLLDVILTTFMFGAF